VVAADVHATDLQVTSARLRCPLVRRSSSPHCVHEGRLSLCGIPPIRFDRIEVSDILDANYVGINDVLLNWSPSMAESNTSVVVGYFMNWFAIQEDGRAANSIARSILKRVMGKTMVSIQA
jgi:hypothetical protein